MIPGINTFICARAAMTATAPGAHPAARLFIIEMDAFYQNDNCDEAPSRTATDDIMTVVQFTITIALQNAFSTATTAATLVWSWKLNDNQDFLK